MYSPTFARVKLISAITLISVVLAACGGEDASNALPATQDQVTGVSQNLSSAVGSLAPTSLATQSIAASSKSNIVAVSSSPLLAVASSKSSNVANSTAPSSRSNSATSAVSNNQPPSVVLSSKAASSRPATSSTALSSKAASSKQAGALGATIEWRQPAARENGSYLELSEIGGYQIRYKAPTATTFNYITIEGNATTNYVFDKSIIGLKFEIAVYDSAGLYSDFVTIH